MNFVKTVIFLIILGSLVSVFGTNWLKPAITGIYMIICYLFSTFSPLVPVVFILLAIIYLLKIPFK